MNTAIPSAEKVKQARTKAGFTQEQAAADVHVSTRMWQKYESGDAQMPFGHWELFLLKRGMLWPVNPNAKPLKEKVKRAGRPENFKKPERE